MYTILCLACGNTLELNEKALTCPYCLQPLDWNTSIPLQGAVEDAVPSSDLTTYNGLEPEEGGDGEDMPD